MVIRISTEYTRRGIDIVLLESDYLRIEVLAGKGGDISRIVDKRTDVNILFESPHRWGSPEDGYVGAPDGTFAYLDHYPGGWQSVVPAAGGPSKVAGAPFSLHGESCLTPFSVEETIDDEDELSVTLTARLRRYPIDVERTISLAIDEPELSVDETVTNHGEVAVDYSWLQHIALGQPLIDPDARLEVPCERVLVDPEQAVDAARFTPGEEFDWPRYNGGETVDLRKFPPKDERVHDLVALTNLHDGHYTVENTKIDLGVRVEFPLDLYEYIWYWQPLGGFTEAPFFGRNYNVGLEPCTSIPNAGLEEAIENGTARTLEAGESQRSQLSVSTYPV
ncbi:DUF4432 family protein [Halomontanus rarus]|uniref:DUF4432 family protein n=1 Tax=Halomontanus rarus TaxID=3034020 RepID=UPI00293BCF33|nr:DUF4432 family protein [Halovivax sp. KZCA124]